MLLLLYSSPTFNKCLNLSLSLDIKGYYSIVNINCMPLKFVKTHNDYSFNTWHNKSNITLFIKGTMLRYH